MRVVRKLKLRLRSILFRQYADDQLHGELVFHLEQLTRENIESGMGPEEARLAAERSLGGVAQIEEECRDKRGVGPLLDTWRDLRHGARMLRRAPVLSVTIILTLGLGIGANTAIFHIADVLLFRSLPVTEPRRLLQLLQPDGPGLRAYGENFAEQDYRALRENAAGYAQLAAGSQAGPAVVTDGEGEETVRRAVVSGNFFQTLGVRAAMGRVMAPEDERVEGRDPPAVLSYTYWQHRFQGDPRVLGRTMRIGGRLFQIAGVAQAGFSGLDVGLMTDVWTPLAGGADGGTRLRLIGRLNSGSSLEQALAPIQAAYHQRMTEMAGHAPPGTPRGLIDHILALRIRAVPAARGLSALKATYQSAVLIVLGLVGLVLLAACTTVATLLEARRNGRCRELAIRRSLGASRWRLLRQLLCESVWMAAAAGVAGWCLAHWTAPWLVRLLGPSEFEVQLPAGVDGRVLGFAMLVSAATVLVFGLMPAWRASGVDINAAFKAGTGWTGSNRRRGTWALVACQTAMSMVLVLGAAVFLRTLINLAGVNAGVERKSVVLANVQFRGQARGRLSAAVWEDLRLRVSEIPGIEAVSLSSGSAFNGAFGNGMVRVQGRSAGLGNGCVFFQASPGFFRTSGISLLKGRDFEPRDLEPGAAPVAVIGASTARQLFPEVDPIGRAFSNFEDSPPRWVTVVGVVQDTRFENLRNPPPKAVYFPYTWPRTFPVLSLAIRTRLEAPVLAASLRAAAGDRGFVVRQVTSQGELIDRTMLLERKLAIAAGLFGVLALVMAAVGLFGMVSYTTAQRTAEFGIRMALGATPGAVTRLVLRESGLVVAVGAFVGLCVALVLGRLSSATLFGVKPYDGAAVAASMLVLGVVSLVAAVVPAVRAARMNPGYALRQD